MVRGQLSAIVALCLELLVPSATRAAKKKPPAPAVVEYRRDVGLGAEHFALPSDKTICVGLGVSLQSGDFFEGLMRTSSPSGVQFYKAGALVDKFPDALSLEIQAVAFWCDLVPFSVPFSAPAPALDDAFMRSLRFEVASKRGLEVVPAEQVSRSVFRIPFTGPFRRFGPGGWVYEIEIRFKQVPLTDYVTLSVLSQDGKLLSRITRGLMDPPLNPLHVRRKNP